MLKWTVFLGLPLTGLQIRMHNGKLVFLFLNQYIYCGYSKEVSSHSFEPPKHICLGIKENRHFYAHFFLLNWTYGYHPSPPPPTITTFVLVMFLGSQQDEPSSDSPQESRLIRVHSVLIPSLECT